MAILNRLTNTIPRGSFKRYTLYAIGEVVLIFAGITLSLWFSNWNDERKDRQVEVTILKEFREGLTRDAGDVEHNIQLREKARANCKKIISFMENPPKYHDSLDHYFSAALQITGTGVQTSAYENLKSRGLHTITNDSLLTKIIHLYDVAYEGIHQSDERHADLFFNFLVGFNAKRFNSTNPYTPMKPLNYTQLMKDQEYKYYLNVLIFYNDFILKESNRILKEISDIISSIDAEIANLE